MKIGDLVRHYSCGGKLELGIILQFGEFEHEVWYPESNIKQWNLIDDLEVVSNWADMTKKFEKEYNDKKL